MSSLNDAYNAVIQACESPYVSYNQLNSIYPHLPPKPERATIYSSFDFNTNTWVQDCCCDCSSLMGWALFRGGYTQSFYACDTLSMMGGYMAQCGWVKVGSPSNVIWQAGDILVGPTHTEMVYQGNGSTTGITMGAHGRDGSYSPEAVSDPTEKLRRLNAQVSILTGLNTYNNYTELWRDPNGGTVTPTINAKWEQINNTSQKYYMANGNTMNDVNNAGFPTTEQLNNMVMITAWLRNNTGASNACIAGIIGNMIWESTLNPNCWQLTPNVNYGGYGLVQFDPPDKYLFQSWTPSDYATNPETNGNGQMEVVKFGIEHTWDVLPTATTPPGEWSPSYTATDTGITYSYTKDQFYSLTDPQEACLSFLWQYERPSVPMSSVRVRNAQWVYNNMSNWGNIGWSHPYTRPNEKQTILLMQRRRKGYFI